VPIYDYICAACGYQVEVIHSVHGEGPAACPKCGGQMKKALVAPAVHFKGSGWARKESGGASKASRSGTRDAEPATGSNGGSDAAAPVGPSEKPAEASGPASTDTD
jgi:putative FmdB family regulatory protein